MEMRLIDIHCHHRKGDAGIAILDSGTTIPTDGLPFSSGIHPWKIADDWRDMFAKVREAARNENAVAIGECGFDRVNSPASLLLQHEVFAAHIALSEEMQKPLIIHLVKGQEELMKAHKAHPHRQPWIIHGFRGGSEQAHQLCKAGFYLSFGERFNSKAVATTPLDRIFVESDESEKPLKEIYEAVAIVRRIGVEELLHTIARNAELFNIKEKKYFHF